MGVGALSSYVSGGAVGAFLGLWLSGRIMALRETNTGIVVDVDLFGWVQFSAAGLWPKIVVILVCAVLGAVVARLFRKITLGR